MMLTPEDVLDDMLDLAKDHFSTGRTLPRMSQSSLRYTREDENACTIKIRASEIVTQSDVSDDIPILAFAYDDTTEQMLGFNRGMVSTNMETATDVYASFMYVPIYINAISRNKIESGRLAHYMKDILSLPLRFELISKPGYHDMLFQSPGNPTIIIEDGQNQITYATPLAGTVTLERVYSVTKKAKTLTQVSAFMNGQNIWNGGPTDE